MEQNYTSEQLVQFIYNDLTITEHFEVQDAIENDAKLKLEYASLYNAYKELPKVQFRPADQTVDAILAYSKNLTTRAYC